MNFLSAALHRRKKKRTAAGPSCGGLGGLLGNFKNRGFDFFQKKFNCAVVYSGLWSRVLGQFKSLTNFWIGYKIDPIHVA